MLLVVTIGYCRGLVTISDPAFILWGIASFPFMLLAPSVQHPWEVEDCFFLLSHSLQLCQDTFHFFAACLAYGQYIFFSWIIWKFNCLLFTKANDDSLATRQDLTFISFCLVINYKESIACSSLGKCYQL